MKEVYIEKLNDDIPYLNNLASYLNNLKSITSKMRDYREPIDFDL